jgi:predicted NBD/HSP70 family sugar kinase
MTLAIGVDVGGTKVAAAVVDEDGRILAKLKRSTPAASPARTEQAIADVVTDGRLCGCGNRGCWEQYCSGNALVAEAREFARRTPEGAVRLLQLGGGVPEGISGPVITRAATEGDPAALRCFQTVGGWLGQGLADLAAILDPACFVIGGGVSEAGDLLLDPARAAFERALTGRGYRPLAEIKVAQLGEDAGIVGAADLARATAAPPPPSPATADPATAVRTTAAPVSAAHTTVPPATVLRAAAPQTTAPSSPSSGPPGSGSFIRSTSMANPVTNAATAKNAAIPGTDQPAAVAMTR